VTLQYYSPKAYDYVREKLKNLLSHPRTLKRWYTVINGQPGFTKESLDSITNIVKKKQPVYCNLVIDEISIRKHIELDSQRNIYGFVNLGVANDMDGDEIQEAKNALVFLAVGINGYWKLPIGYFLIDGLNGKERANLLQKAIELLSDTGVKINSITFDVTSVNTTMVKSLGADLNTRPYILNPHRNEQIYIFLDAAHMIKLVRNAWGDKKYKKNLNGQSELVPKVLQNSKGQPIRWDYLEMLYQLECEKGLRAGTKIIIRRIKYTDEKMNVRLAAQTLSQSVADALMFLKGTEPGFKNVDATVEFVAYMNNAFDILNSRSKFSIKPYNKPISEETITKYKEFTNEFSSYVQGLTFVEHKNDQPIITNVLQLNRKTGFLGLVLGLKN